MEKLFVLAIIKISSEEKAESPALFSDSIQDLIDSLESKINLWYLDDGDLSDYRTILKDLRKLKRKNAGTQN